MWAYIPQNAEIGIFGTILPQMGIITTMLVQVFFLIFFIIRFFHFKLEIFMCNLEF